MRVVFVEGLKGDEMMDVRGSWDGAGSIRVLG
jgi:hypothetical protein